MIFLTGDTHGDFKRFSSTNFPEGKELTKDDYVIVLGDFGLIWDIQSSKNEMYWSKWLNNKPWTTLFIDGNHENFDRLFSPEFEEVPMFDSYVKQISDSIFYLQRGHIYNIDGNSILALGGAMSIDKQFRQSHITWWAQETLSYAEIETTFNNLSKVDNKVDYILTHTSDNKTINEFVGVSKSIYVDAVANYLDVLFNIVDYKHNYFGHMHPVDIWKSSDNKHTCLYQHIIKLKV